MFRTGLMTTAAVALAWGLSSGSVSAAEPKTSDANLCLGAMAGGGADMTAEARLQKLDADGNGFVSSDEFNKCMSDVFAKIDANADDRLSADELEKAHAQMRANASTKQQASAQAGSGQQQNQAATAQGDTKTSAQTAAKSQDQSSSQTAQQQSGDTSAQTQTGQDKSQAKSEMTAQSGTEQSTQTEGKTTTSDAKAQADTKDLKVKSTDQKTVQTDVAKPDSGEVKTETTTQARTEPTQPLSETRVSAEELIGKSVSNPDGENLGEIEDLVIDPENDDMFAVVGVGGFLGMGEKKVTIPYNDLQMSGDKIIVLTAQTKDQLKQMPEYEKDRYRPLSAN